MNAAIVRFDEGLWARLRAMLFARYPDQEWATWIKFGWRLTNDTLILSAVDIVGPQLGDLDDSVSHVAIQEQYSLRIALEAERHEFAVGVAHSHPKSYLPVASAVDDDMDAYYSDYLAGFTRDRPYPSVILSELDGEFVGSGRVWFQGRWLPITRWIAGGASLALWIGRERVPDVPLRERRIARLDASFGRRAAQRIRNARIAVVGAGGTGSPAIEILARAGVGHLIVVDPDIVEESNLERLHGGYTRHVRTQASKVDIAREHVTAIDPEITFEGYIGRVPQPAIVDALARADVIVGCTDQQHSRLALSEIAFRHLVPVIDCGVSLEGENGKVSGQTIQLVYFDGEKPCAACRQMVDRHRITQELMSPEERELSQRAAVAALRRGEAVDPYWRDIPQLNTVGYLTSAAGALAAGSAIGIVSQTFEPGYVRMQLNPLNHPVDVVDWVQDRRSECPCGRLRGYGNLAESQRFITPPAHWPAVRRC